MDSEDYELFVIQMYGVEAWIEHLNSLNYTPEFENISFLSEENKITH